LNQLGGILIAKSTLGYLKNSIFSSVVACARLPIVIVMLIYTLVSFSASFSLLDITILLLT
jgi:hypothetical protein